MHFVGNAASSGAQMILLSRQAREKARKLAQQIEYVEIAHEKDFMDVYTECMSF
ncbi:MAG: ATP-binding protein [Sedimentisphaerales bacterium]|nr:ATP-binding protein [Sedimentisphaerales bacterium]